MAMNREDRLPKWAQDELLKMRADAAFWQAKATIGPADSDTFADARPGGLMPSRPLGSSPRIFFRLAAGDHGSGYVTAYVTMGGQLRIEGGDRIAIHPMASNSAVITCESD